MDRKQDVLALLKARGSAGLGEIAEHLGVVLPGGLVEVSTEQPRGPGRPGHVYRLTAAAGDRFPSGHRELAGELAEFRDGPELERFFEERARRQEAEYGATLAGLDFEERV